MAGTMEDAIIMRHALLAFALLLPAASAMAEPLPFEGRWAYDLAACAVKPGESDMVPTIIANGRIDYYESSCTIDSAEPIGGGEGSAWTVKTTCSGEGETWSSESIFAVEDMGDETRPRQWIDIDLGSGFVIVRRACD